MRMRAGQVRRALHQGLSLILDPVLRLLEYVIVALGIAMLSVVFVQVVLRYAFNESFYGSEEFSRFLFTWFIFMSATLGLDRGIHFAVDVFVKLSPKPVQRLLEFVVHLTVLALLILFVVKGIEFTTRNWRQLSSAMQVPLSYANAAIPVGASLMVLITLRRMLRPRAPES